MPSEISTELPDPAYGSAVANSGDHRRLRVASDGNLIHADAGGVYLAMSERNWQALFAAVQELEVTQPPVTYRLVADDTTQTAGFEVTA